MKRIALLTAVILLTITAVVVTWELRNIVLVFLISLTVAATLDDPVEWLAKRRWPRALAIAAVFFGVFGALFALAAAMFVPIVAEIDPLAQDLIRMYGDVQARLMGFQNLRTTWVTRLPSTEQLAADLAGGQTAVLVQNVLGLTQNLGRGVAELMLSIVLAIYWTADRTRFERLWLSLLAPEQRTRTRRIWRKLETNVGAYIRSEFAQTLLAVALFVAGYLLLGIKYPFLLALVAGLAWLIPLLGGALALIPVSIVGWVSNPATAVAAVVYSLVVLLILEFFLQRRMYTEGRYWGVLLVLVMLAMSSVWGWVGLIVAPPIALAIQIVLDELLTIPATAATPTADLSALQERLNKVRIHVHGQEEVSPRIAGMVERLDHLMAEVKNTDVADYRGGSNYEAAYPEYIAVDPTKDHA